MNETPNQRQTRVILTKRAMIVKLVGLLVLSLLQCTLQDAASLPEFHSVITIDSRGGNPMYSREAFEAFLGRFPAPYYSFITVGDSRSGKSETGNLRIRIHAGITGQSDGTFFKVCDELEPCTKGIDVVAVPRSDGPGTDLFFDVEGGNMAENPQDMSVFLTMGACISSGPLVIVDTNLNDDTVHLVGRIAAHLLDQNSGASCSFREGGPALAILVNKNDGAVRQESKPGGLRAIWDKSTAALAKEAAVISLIFKDIQFFALPYARDETQLRDLSSAFGERVRAIDKQMMTIARHITLVSEDNSGVCFQGNAATIAAAVEDIFKQSKTLAERGFYAAPRVSDFVSRDAASAVTTCGAAFRTATAKWASTACETKCGAWGGGCQVVFEWLEPARAAAERCFVDATANWRPDGDPFGSSVLDPALRQLNADTQQRADELHNLWQHANSVDPARTKHESHTREVSRGHSYQCSRRYGGRCYGIVGPSKYADFCRNAWFAVESRSCTYKRCGESMGCTEWTETSRHEKEVERWKDNMC